MPGRRRPAWLVVGGSAGGTGAIASFLAALPRDFDGRVAVVVHRGLRSGPAMAEALARASGRPVREPLDKDVAEPGVVHLAPPGYHLLVDRDGTLALSVDEPVHGCRPAVDVLFESAARAFGADVVAVVVSGANFDGAAGARAVKKRGGRVYVQSLEEAEMPAMPTAAMEAAAVDGIGPVAELARKVSEVWRGR